MPRLTKSALAVASALLTGVSLAAPAVAAPAVHHTGTATVESARQSAPPPPWSSPLWQSGYRQGYRDGYSDGSNCGHARAIRGPARHRFNPNTVWAGGYSAGYNAGWSAGHARCGRR